MALADLGRLKREFNSLRFEQSRLLDTGPRPSLTSPNEITEPSGSSGFFDRYSALLEKIASYEVKAQRLKQESMKYSNLDTLLSRRMSDPSHQDLRAVLSFDTVTRAQTDGALSTAMDDPATKRRMGDWLLDCLKSSAIQRTVYLNILDGFGIAVSDRNSLANCAEEYWPLELTDRADEPARGSVSANDDIEQHIEQDTGSASNTPPPEKTPASYRANTKSAISLEATRDIANLEEGNRVYDYLGMIGQ